ncbi:hypothetical protein MHK_008592 [Candidatus Magnetomorum sp. HK-1]|nr:hypothetical protein MHK_008592 [Candidatus Magnetomorum sp. HK-1]
MVISHILKKFTDYKNKPALTKGDQSLSYTQLLERVG